MGREDTCGADAVTVGKHTAMLEQLAKDVVEMKDDLKDISKRLSFQDGANETHKFTAPKIERSSSQKMDTKIVVTLVTACITLSFDFILKAIELISKVIH